MTEAQIELLADQNIDPLPVLPLKTSNERCVYKKNAPLNKNDNQVKSLELNVNSSLNKGKPSQSNESSALSPSKIMKGKQSLLEKPPPNPILSSTSRPANSHKKKSFPESAKFQAKVKRKSITATNDTRDKSPTPPLHPAQALAENQLPVVEPVSSKSNPIPKHLDESTIVYLPSKSSAGNSKSRKRRRSFHHASHTGSGEHHSGTSSGGGSYKKGTNSTHSYSQVRAVEYQCAMCNEAYRSECKSGNPWWALTQESCRKCTKIQVR